MAKKTDKTESQEVVTAQLSTESEPSDIVVELLGRIAALEDRLDAMEERFATATAPKAESWGKAIVSNPLNEKMEDVVSVVNDPVVSAAEALELRRSESAAKAAAAKKQGFASDRLAQLAKELEGENISSVRPRLSALQTTGKVIDFRVLRLGSTRPMDHSPERILLTVDTVGLVIKAEVG